MAVAIIVWRKRDEEEKMTVILEEERHQKLTVANTMPTYARRMRAELLSIRERSTHAAKRLLSSSQVGAR